MIFASVHNDNIFIHSNTDHERTSSNREKTTKYQGHCDNGQKYTFVIFSSEEKTEEGKK